jgi:hypothetical protein
MLTTAKRSVDDEQIVIRRQAMVMHGRARCDGSDHLNLGQAPLQSLRKSRHERDACRPASDVMRLIPASPGNNVARVARDREQTAPHLRHH